MGLDARAFVVEKKGKCSKEVAKGWSGGVLTISFPQGASVLVRIGEWAESNQVFLQAGPSVLLQQNKGQGRGCDYGESDSVIGK